MLGIHPIQPKCQYSLVVALAFVSVAVLKAVLDVTVAGLSGRMLDVG